MNILKQIVLDIINFWYIFFGHPKLSEDTINEIDNKIDTALQFPKRFYSVTWKISRWKIFSYQSCDCDINYSKKIILKIFVKPIFGYHYSQIIKGIYCLKCEKIYTEVQKDLD